MMHGVKKAALTLLLCASMVTQTAIPTYALTDSSVSDTDDVDSEYTDTSEDTSDASSASTEPAEGAGTLEESVDETEESTEGASEESGESSNEITSFADSDNLQGGTYTIGKDSTDKNSILESLPSTIEAKIDGSWEDIPVTWTCSSYDAKKAGKYTFTASVSKDYTVAFGVDLPSAEVTLKAQKKASGAKTDSKNNEFSTDALTEEKAEQESTDAAEASSETATVSKSDKSGKAASTANTEEQESNEITAFQEIEDIELSESELKDYKPTSKVTATVNDKNVKIAVTWNKKESKKDEDGKYRITYTAQLEDDYTLADDVELPSFVVTVTPASSTQESDTTYHDLTETSQITDQEVEEAKLDLVTENYIKTHINKKYTRVTDQIVSANWLPITNTYFNGSKISKDDDLDSIMGAIENSDVDSEAYLDGLSKLMGQDTTTIVLYSLDPDSEYLVGLANTMFKDSTWHVQDFQIGLNGTNGQTVDGCIFDYDTGLVYIPKSLYLDTATNKLRVSYLRAQLMQVYDGNNVDEPESTTYATGVSTDGDVTVDKTESNIYDMETTVPVDSDLGKTDVDVKVNGVAVDPEYYSVKDGDLTLKMSSASVGSVEVTEKTDAEKAEAKQDAVKAAIKKLAKSSSVTTTEVDASYFDSDGNVKNADDSSVTLRATTASGVEVAVTGSADTLPEGTTVKATDLTAEEREKEQDQINALSSEAATQVMNYAVNVSLYDSDGEEIEPSSPVKVAISDPSSTDDAKSKIYHFADNTNKPSQMSATVYNDATVFTTAGFSDFSSIKGASIGDITFIDIDLGSVSLGNAGGGQYIKGISSYYDGFGYEDAGMAALFTAIKDQSVWSAEDVAIKYANGSNAVPVYTWRPGYNGVNKDPDKALAELAAAVFSADDASSKYSSTKGTTAFNGYEFGTGYATYWDFHPNVKDFSSKIKSTTGTAADKKHIQALLNVLNDYLPSNDDPYRMTLPCAHLKEGQDTISQEDGTTNKSTGIGGTVNQRMTMAVYQIMPDTSMPTAALADGSTFYSGYWLTMGFVTGKINTQHGVGLVRVHLSYQMSTKPNATLKVTKKISGQADTTDNFHFKVTLNSPENNYSKSLKITGGSGVTVSSETKTQANPKAVATYKATVEFNLNAGQSITISDIPPLTTYKVEETESHGLKPSYSHETGTLYSGKTTECTVTNIGGNGYIVIFPSEEKKSMSQTAETEYTAVADKSSVITREQLYKIHFSFKIDDINLGDMVSGPQLQDSYTKEDGQTQAYWKYSHTFTRQYFTQSKANFNKAVQSTQSQIDAIPNGETATDPTTGDTYTKASAQAKLDGIKNDFANLGDEAACRSKLLSDVVNYKTIQHNVDITEIPSYDYSLDGVTEALPKFGYRQNVNGVTTPDKQTLTTLNLSRDVEYFTNEPWYNRFYINKLDLESRNQIVYATQFDIYENTAGSYDNIGDNSDPVWGNKNVNYECVRIEGDVAKAMGISESDPAYGMYTVHRKAAKDAYTGTTFKDYKEYGTLYFTQKNLGIFAFVEKDSPHDGTKTGYINELLSRPYTWLNGQTDKTYPTPIAVADDVASNRPTHMIRMCKQTHQYKGQMLHDTYTKYSKKYYASSDEAAKSHTYDANGNIPNASYNTKGANATIVNIETEAAGNYNIRYKGQYDHEVKINYNTYAADADMLNARKGQYNDDFYEVENPDRSSEHAFIDERQYGYIRLTKFDLDADRYVDGNEDENYRDGTHHGDGDLDGAIYSLYVAEDNQNGGIRHPDGQTSGAKHNGQYAVLEEQQIFVDTDGDGYCDTWKTQDATLKNGTKVASATIVNGELEFDGLYPGHYYIQEEVRATNSVPSHDNDGNLKNETRKLSFAAGYYAEVDDNNNVVKHYYNFDYMDEQNDEDGMANLGKATQGYVHKSTNTVTYQQDIKGALQLTKLSDVMTTGSSKTNSDGLANAGFTIYQISELSKIKDGTIKKAFTLSEGHDMIKDGRLVRRFDRAGNFIGYKLANPSDTAYTKFANELQGEDGNKIIFVPKYGYYFEVDIQTAYLNQAYGNSGKTAGGTTDILKYDFSKETQALPRVYEDGNVKIPGTSTVLSTNYITEQNAKYKHISNAHGDDQTDDQEYGQDGQGDGFVPSSSVTTNRPYHTAVQTSKEYTLGELFTNSDGVIRTPLLSWGAYIIVETTTPQDKYQCDPLFATVSDTTALQDRTDYYYEFDQSLKNALYLAKIDASTGNIVRQEGIKFRIWDVRRKKYVTVTQQTADGKVQQSDIFATGTEGIVEFPGLSSLEVGEYRIEEVDGPSGYYNAYWDEGHPQTNFTDLGFDQARALMKETLGGAGTDKDHLAYKNMTKAYLGTVDFEVTTEHKYKSSQLITDNNMDVLYLGLRYPDEETLGKITIQKTGEVLVGYKDKDTIQYSDQTSDSDWKQDKTYKKKSDTEQAEADYNIDRTDVVAADSEGAAYTNSQKEAQYVTSPTKDFVYEERPLAGAEYKIVAAENIYTPDYQFNSDGTRMTWFRKGDIVGTVTTGETGEITSFAPAFNQGGSYTEQTVYGRKTVYYPAEDFESNGIIENLWTADRLSKFMKDIYYIPKFQDERVYPNSYTDNNGEQHPVVKVEKDGVLGEVSIYLPLGSYIIKEVKAPYGFVLSNQEQKVTLTWQDQIKQVVFNTNTESVAETKKKIDKFVANNLQWWLGGKDTDGNTLAKRQGTYTTGENGWIGPAETPYYVDENGFLNFYDERVKPKFEGWTDIGVYKRDSETSRQDYNENNIVTLTEDDLKDGTHPEYKVGEKVYKINGEIQWLKGAKIGLYTTDDIYNVDGVLLVKADTQLATATTDSLGRAHFDVDIPYASQTRKAMDFGPFDDNRGGVAARILMTAVGSGSKSIDGNTVGNTGAYYFRELNAPEGYMLNEVPTNVTFKPGDQNTDRVEVSGTVADKKTKVLISKKDIDQTSELAGAKFEVYWVKDLVRLDKNGMVDQNKSNLVLVDSWTSDGTDHQIRGLRVSNLEYGRLTNDEKRENVYILHEVSPAPGYTKGHDIEFEVVQDVQNTEVVEQVLSGKTKYANAVADVKTQAQSIFSQTCTVWVNQMTYPDYVTGTIQAQQNFTDHDGDDKYNYNHSYIYYTNDDANSGKTVKDSDDVSAEQAKTIVNWTLIDNILIIDTQDGVTEESIKKSITPEWIIEELEEDGHSVSDVHQIYFLKNTYSDVVAKQLYADYTVKSYEAKLDKPEAGVTQDASIAQGSKILTTRTKKSPFNSSIAIYTLPAATLRKLDETALNDKTDPSVVVLPDCRWVPATLQHKKFETNEEFYERISAAYGKDGATYHQGVGVLEATKHDPDTGLQGYVYSKLEYHFSDGSIMIQYHDKDTDTYSYEWRLKDGTNLIKTASGNIIVRGDLYHDDTSNLGDDVRMRVVMLDDLTETWFSKKDITTGENVIGASLQIFKENGGLATDYKHNTLSWVSDAGDHKIYGLPAGNYILRETIAPDTNGYVRTTDVKFTIDGTGKVHQVYMPDNYTRVRFDKTDITTGKEIPGAHIVVKNEKGETVDEWDSTDKPHYIDHITPGKYTMTETITPNGYTTAHEITFEVTDKDVVTKVEMKDDYTEVQLSKTDIATGKELPGAKLEIFAYNDKGKLATQPSYSWTSTDKPHIITHIPVGKYALVETTAPDGYVRSEKVDFEVTDQLYHYMDNGTTVNRDSKGNVIANEHLSKVVMKDDYTKVIVHKIDAENGDLVVGATLEVYKASDVKLASNGTYTIKDGAKPVDSWVTDTSEHQMNRLSVGDYVLIETSAPAGYLIASPVTFTVKETSEAQTVTMDELRGIAISKKDISGDHEVPGAKLTVKEKDTGKTVEEWTSNGKEHNVDNKKIKEGKQYELTEDYTPVGYRHAESIIFYVEYKDTGAVIYTRKSSSEPFTKVDKNVITMYDDHTSVHVYKQDEKGNAVAGAKLQIKDARGNVVTSFVTGTEYTDVTALPEGTYTLEEAEVPNGYQIADPVTFTIGSECNSENPVSVTMVDRTNESYNATLAIKKHVTGSGDKSERFWFTITLTDDNGVPAEFTASYRLADTELIKQGHITFEKGVAKVTVADGETLTMSGLPEGMHYKVTENPLYEETEGYQVTMNNAEGKLYADTTVTVEATNHRAEVPKSGSLQITKHVTGDIDLGENEHFLFHVTLTNGFDRRLYAIKVYKQTKAWPVNQVVALYLHRYIGNEHFSLIAGQQGSTALKYTIPLGTKDYYSDYEINVVNLDPFAYTYYEFGNDELEWESGQTVKITSVAENNQKRILNAIVTYSLAKKDANLRAFFVQVGSANIPGTIDQENKTIHVEVPFEINKKHVSIAFAGPDFSYSEGYEQYGTYDLSDTIEFDFHSADSSTTNIYKVFLTCNPLMYDAIPQVTGVSKSRISWQGNVLVYEGDLNQVQSVAIFDALGKNVYLRQGLDRATLDMGFLKAGSYFVRIHTAGGLLVQKFSTRSGR